VVRHPPRINGPNPVVFCGSSNLSSGGESCNGDNLLAIYDRDIATAYAVEAIWACPGRPLWAADGATM
jgi:hypothetical protein